MTNADNSTELRRDNWKYAVATAIAELPDDIQVSVGHYDESADCLLIKIACEPVDDGDGESRVNTVKVRWWNTRREELESYIRESPESGLEGHIEVETLRGVIDKPSISIEPDGASGSTSGPIPGTGTVELMKRMIQEAILDEMHEGGGVSMVDKDRKGRFVREDGSYILDWQRPKRR